MRNGKVSGSGAVLRGMCAAILIAFCAGLPAAPDAVADGKPSASRSSAITNSLPAAITGLKMRPLDRLNY